MKSCSFPEGKLISIIVLSYNSANTILDTLNSIERQTYYKEDIDIYISDDSSEDDSLNIANEWARIHSKKFRNVHVLTTEINSGICANCNNALKFINEGWVKIIAADDILMDSCLESNYEYIKCNPEAKFVLSNVELFSNGNNRTNIKKLDVNFFSLDVNKQHRYIIFRSLSNTPSAFISSKVFNTIGLMDETFPMMEDYPLWFRTTQAGIKIHYLDELTVRYRIGDSISRTSSELIPLKFTELCLRVDNELVLKSSSKKLYGLVRVKIMLTQLALKVSKIFNNKPNFISKFLMKMIFISSKMYSILISKVVVL
ncbi:glycosyltransferase [Vibrio splendidus]|uniref:glycosyltransferase family 2 protein n=1 Tax=Vibrio splendidus TaxID=29497 RepID=UPI00148D1EE5|nr:glycosyltransferase [Vibrio splendidus]NOJ06576.1 glycosyltransferase [Vibrio splendidus]